MVPPGRRDIAAMKQLHLFVLGEYITIPPAALHSSSVIALADNAEKASVEKTAKDRSNFLFI